MCAFFCLEYVLIEIEKNKIRFCLFFLFCIFFDKNSAVIAKKRRKGLTGNGFRKIISSVKWLAIAA